MAIRITLPQWVQGVLGEHSSYSSDEDKMRLAITLARENVLRATGGPFGAVVFQRPGNRLVAAGVNMVEGLNNSCTPKLSLSCWRKIACTRIRSMRKDYRHTN